MMSVRIGVSASAVVLSIACLGGAGAEDLPEVAPGASNEASGGAGTGSTDDVGGATANAGGGAWDVAPADAGELDAGLRGADAATAVTVDAGSGTDAANPSTDAGTEPTTSACAECAGPRDNAAGCDCEAGRCCDYVAWFVAGSPRPADCECDSGPCCDGCYILQANLPCGEVVTLSECTAGLPSAQAWGEVNCTGDFDFGLYREFSAQHCSGTSPDCDGAVWGKLRGESGSCLQDETTVCLEGQCTSVPECQR